MQEKNGSVMWLSGFGSMVAAMAIITKVDSGAANGKRRRSSSPGGARTTNGIRAGR